MITFLQVVFVFVCILLIGLILIQAGKGQGLAGAFGSFAGNAAQNLFGARTTDILTKITAWITVVFFGLALIIAYMQAQETKSVMTSVVAKEEAKAPTKQAGDMDKKISDLTDKLLNKKKTDKKDDVKPADDKAVSSVKNVKKEENSKAAE